MNYGKGENGEKKGQERGRRVGIQIRKESTEVTTKENNESGRERREWDRKK